MPSGDSFNKNSTSVNLSWGKDTTGLERIMLAAQGDLQRLLSAFFARPISIELVYANTAPRLAPASPERPVTQGRQVKLICSKKTVCVATSSVVITSPECEHLFLDEKYPIGQLFRTLGHKPDFSLVNVETEGRELRRLYKLETEGIVCEILEVFPDRNMFVLGEAWLDQEAGKFAGEAISPVPAVASY